MEFDVKKLKYDLDQILGHFGLEATTNCKYLQEWLQITVPASYTLPDLLEEKRKRLAYEGNMWNEEELKMHFLSFVFSFSNLEVANKMKLFYERSLSDVVQNTPLSVVCDALLASPYGINTPKKPYFFLQEFKKGKKAANDAEGQMLIAMLIAQHQNADGNPVYGCYLIGKDWYFTTLHEKKYCFSKTYDATQLTELIEILFILQNLKNIVKL
jgi:hypothetical protein